MDRLLLVFSKRLAKPPTALQSTPEATYLDMGESWKTRDFTLIPRSDRPEVRLGAVRVRWLARVIRYDHLVVNKCLP